MARPSRTAQRTTKHTTERTTTAHGAHEHPADTLGAEGITLAYAERTVVDDLTVTLPAGKVTVIVGANACGKSTLLRGLARLLRPVRGSVILNGTDIHTQSTKSVARILGLLPQTPVAPDGISVADLVGRGRYPHQGWFRQWTPEDDAAVAGALEATDTLALADRSVDELSGGQRQRVWIAMALAQQTGILLLDEPTTFLDVTHQIEVLDLITDLNHRAGTTVVMVLHDLNLAARYADHLIAMSDGRIVAEGPPAVVVTEETVSGVFNLECRIIEDPVSGTPMVVPVGRHHGPGVTLPVQGGAGSGDVGASPGPASEPEGETTRGPESGSGQKPSVGPGRGYRRNPQDSVPAPVPDTDEATDPASVPTTVEAAS